MKKFFLLSLIFLGFLASDMAAQTTVSGNSVPGSVSVEGKEMKLKGAGLREKWFLDLYVGGLYLSRSMDDANQIMAADEPMAIRLDIVSKLISSDKMISATNEGFEKSTNGNLEPYQDRIDKFIGVFKMKEITKGDLYLIGYHPEFGTIVYVNGTKKATIKGLDFKKVLFGIWLGDDPADEDLKEGMLGQG